MLHFEPLFKATTKSKRWKFALTWTNLFVPDNIIVPYIKENIIAKILNVDDYELIDPNWMFSLIFTNSWSPFLFSALDVDKWIHFTNHLNIFFKFTLK